jgi:hypothetical protein
MQWLKLVIPATQEVEMGRIAVWSHPRQKVSKPPLLISTNKPDVVV